MQAKDIQETISRLEAHLEATRADYCTCLKPALSDADLDRLEKQHQMKLPADLRALYQWKNGQHDSCFDAFVNNSTFVPLEEALDTAAELTSMIGTDFETENWWNAQWIPIFHNGGGDYICYDLGGAFTGNHGQLIEFWHADSDRNVIAPSLNAFLSQLNRFYENTPQQDFDEYFKIENIHGYPLSFNGATKP